MASEVVKIARWLHWKRDVPVQEISRLLDESPYLVAQWCRRQKRAIQKPKGKV